MENFEQAPVEKPKKRSLVSKIAWGALIAGAGVAIATVVGFIVAPVSTMKLIESIAGIFGPEAKEFVHNIIGKFNISEIQALENGSKVGNFVKEGDKLKVATEEMVKQEVAKGGEVIKGTIGAGTGPTADAVTNAGLNLAENTQKVGAATTALQKATATQSGIGALLGTGASSQLDGTVKTAQATLEGAKTAAEKAGTELTKAITANNLPSIEKTVIEKAHTTAVDAGKGWFGSSWRLFNADPAYAKATTALAERKEAIKVATELAVEKSDGLIGFITHNKIISGIGAALATIGLISASDRSKEEEQEDYAPRLHEANENFAMREDMRRMQTMMALKAAAAGHPDALAGAASRA